MLHSYQLPYHTRLATKCCQSIPLQHPWRLPAWQLPRPRFPDHGALWQGVSNRLGGHVSTRKGRGIRTFHQGRCIKTYQNHSKTVGGSTIENGGSLSCLDSFLGCVRCEMMWNGGCVCMTVYGTMYLLPVVGTCWNMLECREYVARWNNMKGTAQGTATEFPTQDSPGLNAL